ncbi:MAG: hypothetical protein AB1646_07580 [Thermodesulfobacteriota bacterium]
MLRERNLQNIIRSFPNLIDARLKWMRRGRLGETNVCLDETNLKGWGGKIDLAFVTEDTVYLVEVKLDVVDEGTFIQFARYEAALRDAYPSHEIRGFLVGTRCPNRKTLEKKLGGSARIILFGQDIPAPNAIMRCKNCQAGVDCHGKSCPICGKTLQ